MTFKVKTSYFRVGTKCWHYGIIVGLKGRRLKVIGKEFV
jgi:hypothetical protein